MLMLMLMKMMIALPMLLLLDASKGDAYVVVDDVDAETKMMNDACHLVGANDVLMLLLLLVVMLVMLIMI